MRLNILILIALALTVAAVALNVGELAIKLSAMAVIVLVALRVLAWLAGDTLYGPRTDAKVEGKSGGETGNAQR